MAVTGQDKVAVTGQDKGPRLEKTAANNGLDNLTGNRLIVYGLNRMALARNFVNRICVAKDFGPALRVPLPAGFCSQHPAL